MGADADPGAAADARRRGRAAVRRPRAARPPPLPRASLAPLRVVPDLAEVDEDACLLADGPGVVPGRDRDGVAGADLALGSVVHDDVHPAGEHVAEMRGLAAVRLGERLDVLGPAPAWLEGAL